MSFLGWITLAPLFGFFLILFLPRNNPALIRQVTLLLSLVIFAGSLGLLSGTQPDTNVPWIPDFNINFHLSIDGLSIWLVLLSTLLTPIAVLISWKYIDHRVKEYHALLFLLEFGVIGVFVAMDLFLFYVFWEVSLVPMYLLVGIWGHERRIYAAVKFFLYTMAASVLMLVAIVYVYLQAGTFSYPEILRMIGSSQLVFSPTAQFWLFLAFFVAFAVKVPLFPLHTWLPDAHVEAPTAGSVMLASVMLKLGTYGIVRFCLPMFPGAARECADWIVALAIIGIIYGALVALVQPNMKKLVAYSSVSHLGFVVLGIFSFTQYGMDGAVYQMLNHGISTGALFILVGCLYERRHSLEIKDYGGVGTVAPWLSIVFVVTTLASVGLPTLNNFVGEFMVLVGAAKVSLTWAALASLGVILSVCYMLWLYQRTFTGETPEEVRKHVYDLTPREWAALLPLVILMVWMGISAQTFLPRITASTSPILKQTTVNVPFQVQDATPASQEVADAR
ncbi:MAG: NADH-quinone oxidoreductase subunit M [Bryobacterales bacterium]|nr:NADH-quinone oxidoreductase subunit M [Bryobacterales bacterium]